MHVLSVTIKDSVRRQTIQSVAAALVAAANSPKYERIAFGGRLPRGRAGVVLDLIGKKITGHKLNPIPTNLLDRVIHFPLDEMREGLRAASEGKDILVGSADYGFLLRWNGPGYEVFATGDDSEHHGTDTNAPLH